jgi:hypothetical protein
MDNGNKYLCWMEGKSFISLGKGSGVRKLWNHMSEVETSDMIALFFFLKIVSYLLIGSLRTLHVKCYNSFSYLVTNFKLFIYCL